MHSNDDIRRLLAENAVHTARAQAQDGVIRASCAEALQEVERRLAAIKPADAMLDEATAHAYRRLVDERGRLATLLGSPTSGG